MQHFKQFKPMQSAMVSTETSLALPSARGSAPEHMVCAVEIARCFVIRNLTKGHYSCVTVSKIETANTGKFSETGAKGLISLQKRPKLSNLGMFLEYKLSTHPILRVTHQVCSNRPDQKARSATKNFLTTQ